MSHSHWRCLEQRGSGRWTALLAALEADQPVPAGVAAEEEEEAAAGASLSAAFLRPENRLHVRKLVRAYGVPSALRAKVWPALLGADVKHANARAANARFYLSLVQRYEAVEVRGAPPTSPISPNSPARRCRTTSHATPCQRGRARGEPGSLTSSFQQPGCPLPAHTID
eukprot:COSAG01_NODE_7665_length_3107_cov_2.577793_5_plen_169_part_00